MSENEMDELNKLKDAAEQLHDHYRNEDPPQGVCVVNLLESLKSIMDDCDARYEGAASTYFGC